MSISPVYLLDTNVFIEAARRYYAFDIVPAFWQALIRLADEGYVISIDRVKDETDRGKDGLATWVNDSFHEALASTKDPDVIIAYRDIIVWSQRKNQYTNAAKADFARAGNADAWIVAYAAAHGCVVVTHEELNLNVRRRIPIPNVCQAFSVGYVNTFQMLRTLGVRLG